MSEAPALLTVREAALYLRGSEEAPALDFVRSLIVDGRISAIKHRNRWMVQRASLEALATPELAEQSTAKPPRRVMGVSVPFVSPLPRRADFRSERADFASRRDADRLGEKTAALRTGRA